MKAKYRILFCYIPIILLMCISLFDMLAARNISSMYQNYVWKQLVWFVLGFGVLFLLRHLKWKTILSYSKFLYYGNVLLLILVLFFGKNVNGARAWFDLYFFSFQPSELMKISLTLYLITIVQNHKGKDFTLLLKILLYTAIPATLTFLQPDTSSLLFFFLIALATILISDISKRYIYSIFAIVAIGLSIFFYLYFAQKDFFLKVFGTSFFYRMDRLLDFKNQSGMQLENALISIGSAGTTGFGIHSVPIYYPEAPTDFIFALTLSVFGLPGGIIALACYFVLDIYFIYLFLQNKKEDQRMFYASFLFLLIFSEIQNIAMNLGLLPIMGIPLTFLSYGGTNLLMTFIFLGMILSIEHQKEKYPVRIF